MKYEGANRLARALDKRSKKLSDQPMTLDFGVILPGGMLRTNSFGFDIPPSGYIMCNTLYNDGLSAGDHVIVAWIGNDVVIIDRITRR